MATAYSAAVAMLARRELSEAQLRQRLARRQHDPDDIDRAVERLKENRSLDDARVAGAIARMETGIRKRGRLRVRRRIEAAGISPAVAEQAVRDVFEEIDPDALLEASLRKRLRAGATVTGPRERARLYRYLLAQGFESDRIAAALRRIARARDDESDAS